VLATPAWNEDLIERELQGYLAAVDEGLPVLEEPGGFVLTILVLSDVCGALWRKRPRAIGRRTAAIRTRSDPRTQVPPVFYQD
jgi:hypothetical protein